jgi:hypothetical protein
MAETLAETKMLYIQCNIDGETLPIRPVVNRAFGYGRILVSIVLFYFHKMRA